MVAVTIQPANQTEFKTLVAAFNTGYSGYTIPVNVDGPQLRHHIEQNDVDLEASCIALHDDQVVGFVLLGIRGEKGWIGGLGVHPEYRRQGIGVQLMCAAIHNAREQKLQTTQLEVIEGNVAAHQLYTGLGFAEVRRLLILEGKPDTLIYQNDMTIEDVSPDQALAYFHSFHATDVPWQRGYETLAKPSSTLQGWLLKKGDVVMAYAIGRSAANHIHFADLAASHSDAVQQLVSVIHKQHEQATGHFVNLGEDDPVWTVLASLGYRPVLSQFEMILTL